MYSDTCDDDMNSMLEEMIDASNSTVEASIRTLEKLATEADAAALFVTTWAVLQHSRTPPTESSHGTVPAKTELLAYHLYPFFGRSDAAVTVPQARLCAREASRLFHNLRYSSLEPSGDPARELGDELRRRTEVVRGLAYIEQTVEEINAVQGRFEAWFAERVGVGPDRAVALLRAVIAAEGRAYERREEDVAKAGEQGEANWRRIKRKPRRRRSEGERALLERFRRADDAGWEGATQKLLEVSVEDVPVAFSDLAGHEAGFTEAEWDALLSLLGLTPAVRQTLTGAVGVREHPLYVLPGSRVLLTNLNHALDVLFERFESAAREDKSFYDRRYQRHKAAWLEGKVDDYLKRLFPESAVYRSLRYPDPDREGGVAELDAAVWWEPHLLLVEAKAKRFRLEARLGDPARLRNDLKANLEDAFAQAQRASRHLHSVPLAEFTETRTGRRLRVRPGEVEDVHLLTVNLHDLSGLELRHTELVLLGLFGAGEHPVSMSRANLDVISHVCESSDVFVHYLARRRALQGRPARLRSDELELFGWYLDSGYQVAHLWDNTAEPYALAIGGYQNAFDSWIDHRYGRSDAPPDLGLNVPGEVRELLGGLRRQPGKESRHLAFALLDLPRRTLVRLADAMRDLREDPPPPDGRFRRIVFQENDGVLAVVATTSRPLPELEHNLTLRLNVEKYRHRVERALGFGLAPQPGGLGVVTALVLEGSWEPDAELEALLAGEPTAKVRLPKGERPPGRNAPCVCGSGRKFKHCCLHRIRG